MGGQGEELASLIDVAAVERGAKAIAGWSRDCLR